MEDPERIIIKLGPLNNRTLKYARRLAHEIPLLHCELDLAGERHMLIFVYEENLHVVRARPEMFNCGIVRGYIGQQYVSFDNDLSEIIRPSPVTPSIIEGHPDPLGDILMSLEPQLVSIVQTLNEWIWIRDYTGMVWLRIYPCNESVKMKLRELAMFNLCLPIEFASPDAEEVLVLTFLDIMFPILMEPCLYGCTVEEGRFFKPRASVRKWHVIKLKDRNTHFGANSTKHILTRYVTCWMYHPLLSLGFWYFLMITYWVFIGRKDLQIHARALALGKARFDVEWYSAAATLGSVIGAYLGLSMPH